MGARLAGASGWHCGGSSGSRGRCRTRTESSALQQLRSPSRPACAAISRIASAADGPDAAGDGPVGADGDEGREIGIGLRHRCPVAHVGCGARWYIERSRPCSGVTKPTRDEREEAVEAARGWADRAALRAMRASRVRATGRAILPGAGVRQRRPRAPPRTQPGSAVVRVGQRRVQLDAVAAVDDGELPLVIGGDCTITLGVIAGFRRRHPDVGLVYVDGDADLGTGSGHGLGHPGLRGRGPSARPGRARAGRAWPGPPPLLEPARLALLGGDPRETDDAGRQFLAGLGVSFQEGPAPGRRPGAGAARRARGRGRGGQRPGRGALRRGRRRLGRPAAEQLPALRVAGCCSRTRPPPCACCAWHPSFAGMVLTEVNPTYDADGSQLQRYISALVGGAGRAGPGNRGGLAEPDTLRVSGPGQRGPAREAR